MSGLEGRGVCKAFGSRHVLRAVSMSADRGALTAIRGPSGSGKSTLLSVLGGLAAPDAGDVLLDGVRLLRRELEQRVAWVPQASNSVPRRTVLDNVAIGGLCAGMSRPDAEEVARRCLGELGLEHLAASPARHVSGGELQRVAVARALATARPIVLADEPTGNLDLAATRAVIESLVSAASSGIIVLVATHDPMVSDAAGARVDLR